MSFIAVALQVVVHAQLGYLLAIGLAVLALGFLFGLAAGTGLADRRIVIDPDGE